MKIFIFFLLSSFSLLFARDISDDSLRALAQQNGLKSTPKSYEQLLKTVDNAKNHMTPKKINLGRTLFFEPLLSHDGSLTCASCHKIGEGGDDNLPTAIGFDGRKNPKHLNSPTVLDVATAKFLFWDGRAKSLEEQVGGPIQASFEMNSSPKELVKRISNETMYTETFQDVFGGKITFENIKKAIAVYERTLLTRGSYDDFLDGNDTAISKEAKEGLRLFIQKSCVKCHYGIALGAR
ncbi:MAG: cytochrome-c peroxidase, partial [Epsilonproteobacteria bacterium]|nr:cytochrome-c peroxidase [Campylobacterota bacterium]